ncbi:NAC transcription factor 56-like [Elaeis guineensis]|uniref:NAC transcription factor 56-like n=1 Tax=Elaeis guineensis var. tenera TaxID=51953 RepID=UPI003C6D54FE
MANRNFEWFFFTWTTRKHPDAKQSKRACRVAGQGRWKSNQSVKPVLNEEGQVIGSRQNFSYMERTPSGKEEKSIWLMEEYSIQNLRKGGDAAMPMDQNRLDDWVICKIYLTPCARKELSGEDVPTMEVPEIENQPLAYAPDTLPQLTDALDQEAESCAGVLHDSSLQSPTSDEIDEFLESLPIDEFLQQIANAPDESPGIDQHDKKCLPPPQLLD